MSDTQTGQAIAVQQQRPQRIEILAATPLFDTAKFEHMGRIATMMAQVTCIPDHLCRDMTASGNPKPLLHFDNIRANCFSVVNIADRWGIDPFAVAECMSLVHGRRCFEGKLIAAIIETKLGIDLRYEWFGEKGTDSYGIRIWDSGDPEHMVEGTVGDWRTNDKQGNVNGQWKGANAHRQLKYRGDREWCRFWAPALLLGVYTDDEMSALEDDVRARRAAPVAQQVQHVPITERLKQKQITAQEERGEGFSADQIRKTTAAAQQDDEPPRLNSAGAPEAEEEEVEETAASATEVEAAAIKLAQAQKTVRAQADAAEAKKTRATKATQAQAEEEPAETLLDIARGQATNGKAAFEAWFNRLKPEQLDELAPQMRGLAAMAKAADEAASKVAAE